MFRRTKKSKVFCIGQNKTGTTSLEVLLESLGYRMGSQSSGEMLLRDWSMRNFRRILQLARTADAFQDIPFSLRFTFIALDQHFPGAKFILTERESAVAWFESLVRFHTGLIGKGRVPTAADLKACPYRYPGFLWDAQQAKYGVTDDETLYQRERYVDVYKRHNQEVKDYFRGRPEDLLVVNVGESHAVRATYEFLGHPYRGEVMPHENASK
jgi:hypothetical protein